MGGVLSSVERSSSPQLPLSSSSGVLDRSASGGRRGGSRNPRLNTRKRRRPPPPHHQRVLSLATDGETTSDEEDEDDIESVYSSSNEESHSVAPGGSSRDGQTKRLKLDSTAQYIYEKLFIQGEGSDVIIRCMGREWKLHRLYLSQSKYFECMFGGRWLEAQQNAINIDIPDSLVTESALNIAFGSLYCGEVNIPTDEVVAVLSAASLFQLDGMVDLCVKIMHQNIKLSTVGHYFNAAQLYGQAKLARKCAKWLERVLMFTQSLDLLKSITIELMVTIIHSCNFFVNQVEMDIYTLLKKWVFLRLNPSWSGQRRDLLDAKDAFFLSHCSNRLSFLETEMGLPFVAAFRGLRLQYISADRASLIKIEQDNIIPKQWLKDICWIQWKAMLDSESSTGGTTLMSPAPSANAATATSGANLQSQLLRSPQSPRSNTSSTRSPSQCLANSSTASSSSLGSSQWPSCLSTVFNKYSMRCGRILDIPNNDYCWRWTGFNYGIDLLMLFSNNQLMIKRNVNTHPTTQSLSMQEKREMMLRVSALSFDENYNPVYLKTSGIMCKELGKDEEILIMDIDRYATCPIYLSFNVLTTVPDMELLHQATSQQKAAGSVGCGSCSSPAVVGSAAEESSDASTSYLPPGGGGGTEMTASSTLNEVSHYDQDN